MSVIQKTLSYKLKPIKEERINLAQSAGSARFIYNYGLNLVKEAFDNKIKIPSYTDLANTLPELKELPKTSWLTSVHSQVLQQALKDLDNGLKHFFRRLKNKKEKPGFPKFKKKGVKDSFRYPQSIKCKESKVYLPKIGWVRYANSRPIEGTIKQATVKREGNHWFVHIACEVEKEIKLARMVEERAIGIDVGLLYFAYLSNGIAIENPTFLKNALRKLKKCQRKVSRAKKGSNNRKKLVQKLAKLHREIKNKRKDFLHKLSTELIKNHDIVIVEDLHIKGMVRNRNLAQSIADVGWGLFLSMLKYKAAWNGKHFVSVDRFFPSSKTCSSCSAKQAMPLHIRTYKCNVCTLVIDRDLNASKNIKAAGMSVLQASSVNAC